MGTRLLILNYDPVFDDRVLSLLGALPKIELRIVRTPPDAIHVLLREEFDLFFIEGAPAVAIEQAVVTRQHFPSLEIVCLVNEPATAVLREQAVDQRIQLLPTRQRDRALRHELRALVAAFDHSAGAASEGIDPCHSLIGNLNQFSTAEVLQMSCLSQRSGRFTFKSGRGTIEIYLHHGLVRHALYDTLGGEAAVAEVFRWRQGRFFFEEGIISQIQTVNRPWTHLMLENMQKFDETMQMVGTAAQR